MSNRTLSLDEHVAVQNRLQLFGASAVQLFEDDELDAFIDACEHSDAVAPLLDPTAWMRGHDQLRQVIDHARALQKFRRAVRGDR